MTEERLLRLASEAREARAHSIAAALDETIRVLDQMLATGRHLSSRRVKRIRVRLAVMHYAALEGVEPKAALSQGVTAETAPRGRTAGHPRCGP